MRGRKSRADEWLTEDGLLLLEGFARDGLTNKDIAEKKIGIAETTFTEWKRRFSVISVALKKDIGGGKTKYGQRIYNTN